MKLRKTHVMLAALVLALAFVIWYRWPVHCTASLQMTRWDSDLQQPSDRIITVEVDMKTYRSLFGNWDYTGTITADGMEYAEKRDYDGFAGYLKGLQDRLQNGIRQPAFGRREGEHPAGVAGFAKVAYGRGRRTIDQATVTLSGQRQSGLWSTDWAWDTE